MTGTSTGLTSDEVMAAFTATWARFAAAVDQFAADQVDQAGPNGTWSVKQIVGHVAYWDGYEADNLARRHEMAEIDWQAMNDANIAEIAGRGYAELRAELDAHHQRLAGAMRMPHHLPLDRLKSLTCDHYEEHAAELESRLG